MGEAEGSSSSSRRKTTMESLSLEINRYPRDLLTRFISSAGEKRRARTREEEEEEEEREEADEIELNLGLSLGGRFGVDKSPSATKLARSSSIAGPIPESFFKDGGGGGVGSDSYSHPHQQLMRTSSLPTETEEEWRKRKEMQSLRRMEAKRRRSEKQRNSSVGGGGRVVERGDLGFVEEEKLSRGGSWVVSRPQGSLNSRSREGSQGSIESSHGGGGGGGSSSGGGAAPIQGSGSGGESRSPGQDQCNQLPVPAKSTATATENHKRAREIGTSAMEDMPCVFTIGDGPHGRRVEGILYKYGRGEEVRIMCVCHGSFLSPAEFVKHAGGINVDHPLKHIVVNPAGPSFL
ncbi:Ninja-family protein AFP2 [Linum grandiflorum]